jgi:hypothetical protein
LPKCHGFHATFFQCLWASGWSHNIPPAHNIGHLLCRCQ